MCFILYSLAGVHYLHLCDLDFSALWLQVSWWYKGCCSELFSLSIFFCNCAAQWVYIYTGGYLLMFLNKIHGSWIFFKNCKKDPISFCTDFTVLAHCAIQVLVTNIWYIVLLNKGPFSTCFIYNSIYTNVILNKSFKIINKIDIFLP